MEEKKKNHPITKAHRLAPAQLPSANEAPSILPVPHPAHTPCQQQGSAGLRMDGTRLFTFVALRIDELGRG